MQTKKLVLIAVLSSVAFLLMMINMPLPFLPAFLKIDGSELPALIAAIMLGPVAGVSVEALKNLLHFIMFGSPTGIPIDQVANFLAGTFFIVPTYFVFKKINSVKGLILGLAVGSVSMAIVMSILNYYAILPLYTALLNMPTMSGEEIRALIVAGIIPFNLIKGLAVSVLFVLIYPKLSSVMRKSSYVDEAA
ncbi:ECF transporter S component [Bacillus sp. HMF5848]|uniref:ECF transporter S component n=1 Tax=Bacillus sp. HMF5848 TaxID=2495421 RepID=UPI000F79900C|nr:ECF transporter S component [Bacillus sp. HMF5848]RSK27482.1 ECF transporter S component [Bacillus sp. HMF5848]